MTFTEWLLTQTGRTDPVGDLARDAATMHQIGRLDPTATAERFNAHLHLNGACEPALAAFRVAAAEYAALPR